MRPERQRPVVVGNRLLESLRLVMKERARGVRCGVFRIDRDGRRQVCQRFVLATADQVNAGSEPKGVNRLRIEFHNPRKIGQGPFLVVLGHPDAGPHLVCQGNSGFVLDQRGYNFQRLVQALHETQYVGVKEPDSNPLRRRRCRAFQVGQRGFDVLEV